VTFSSFAALRRPAIWLLMVIAISVAMPAQAHIPAPTTIENIDLRASQIGAEVITDEAVFVASKREASKPCSASSCADVQQHLMHARYYNPQWGRFLSADPGKDWNPKQPQRWNMYAYAGSNPMGLTDPTGRKVACANEPSRCTATDAFPQRAAEHQETPAGDGFIFGSITGTTDTPVRGAAEAIRLVGYNTASGLYAGAIGAIGGEIGSHENYIGAFQGLEVTTESSSPERIEIRELSLGLEIPFLAGVGGWFGDYKTNDEHGGVVFASGGAIGQHGALGGGMSSDTFRLLAPYVLKVSSAPLVLPVP
jgi:RHS repeat-associated protein